MIAVDATSISILLGVAYFLLDRGINSFLAIILTTLSLLLLLLSLIVGIIEYRPLPFQFLNPTDLVREVHQDDKTYGYAVRKSAGTVSAIVDIDIGIVNKKARMFKIMLSLMLGAFPLMGLGTLSIFGFLICG